MYIINDLHSFLGNLSLWESHFIAKVLLLSQIISFLVGKSVSLNDLSCICYRCYLYGFHCSHEPYSDIVIVIDWLLAIFISWDSHNERNPCFFVLSRFLYLQLVLKQFKSFYRKPYSWVYISGFCFPLLCELIKDYKQSANYLCVVRTLFTLNLLYFDYSLVILQIIVWKS